MVCGIYCYKDNLKNDSVVYVGLDSHIDENRRHKQHFQDSNYNEQQINRVLQNNPTRYSYHVLKKGDFDENLLKALEIIYIRRYNPKFNYTFGGDGCFGYKHSKEVKEKLSKLRMGENNPRYGKLVSFETRKKMSESHKGLFVKSDNPQWKNYARIVKEGKTKAGTQIYCIRHDGKRIKRLTNFNKLIGWFKENYPNQKLRVDI